jgi:hypothetical protein
VVEEQVDIELELGYLSPQAILIQLLLVLVVLDHLQLMLEAMVLVQYFLQLLLQVAVAVVRNMAGTTRVLLQGLVVLVVALVGISQECLQEEQVILHL